MPAGHARQLDPRIDRCGGVRQLRPRQVQLALRCDRLPPVPRRLLLRRWVVPRRNSASRARLAAQRHPSANRLSGGHLQPSRAQQIARRLHRLPAGSRRAAQRWHHAGWLVRALRSGLSAGQPWYALVLPVRAIAGTALGGTAPLRRMRAGQVQRYGRRNGMPALPSWILPRRSGRA